MINGEGTTQVNDESAPIKKGDTVPIRIKDVHSFANPGSADLEFIVYGVALEKGKVDIADAQSTWIPIYGCAGAVSGPQHSCLPGSWSTDTESLKPASAPAVLIRAERASPHR